MRFSVTALSVSERFPPLVGESVLSAGTLSTLLLIGAA